MPASPPLGFARDGDVIALVGDVPRSSRCSELAKLRGQALPDGLPMGHRRRPRGHRSGPRRRARRRPLAAPRYRRGRLRCAGRVGLAGGRGARITVEGWNELNLFGEGSGGWILTGDRAVFEAMSDRIATTIFGATGGDRLVIEHGGIDVTLDELRAAWAERPEALLPVAGASR